MAVRPYITPQQLQLKLNELAPLTKRFDALNVHVAITDENAHILYANKVAAEKTGYLNTFEVIGKNPGDLWGGQMDRVFFEQLWKTIKEEKKQFKGKLKNIRKDGAEYWVELQITPIFNKDNEIKYFVAAEPEVYEAQSFPEALREAVEAFQAQVKALV